MDVEQFGEIFDDMMSKSDETLNSKRAEYAVDHDILHNFKMSAAIQQTNMRGALSGFITKHIISIYDMLAEETPRPLEVWDEKLLDAINYLILLKAIVVEETQELEQAQRELMRPMLVNHPSSSRPLDVATPKED